MIFKLFQNIFSSCWGILFFSSVVISLLLYSLRGYIRQVRLAFQLRGPKTIPFIGNCLLMANKNLMMEEASTAYERYGPIARIWLTLLPTFVILEPEHIQAVLSSSKHTGKLFVYRFMHNFLGKGLITSSGDEWLQHRRLLQPSFHLSILDKFIDSFADGADAFVNRIKERGAAPINITELVNECVLDVLNETVFGVPIKDKLRGKGVNDNSPYRQGKILLPYRLSKPWLMLDWLYHLTEAASKEVNQKSKLDDFTRIRVAERRKAREQGVSLGRSCLVDFMLEVAEKNPEFTEEDIVNEANTFMLAGQDSVGASVAFTLFLLAKHQKEQEKCYQEIVTVCKDTRGTASMNELRRMNYLEQCIKESLRLYPSVPILARQTTEDIQMGDKVLPAKSMVAFCIYSTHRLPHIYPDPERFDPSRFSPENCEKRNPYSFIGFSAGPRICLGYRYAMVEMKTIISRILRDFTLDVVAGKEEIKPTFRITLRAHGGLWIRFQKRKRGEDGESLIGEKLSDSCE